MFGSFDHKGNVVYKIITKVHTLRITRVAGKMVGKQQTPFHPGRKILDGVVILHEVLHELKRSKTPEVILKLDFEKAYDKVSWKFLEVMKKGFDSKWIDWVMKVGFRRKSGGGCKWRERGRRVL